MLGCNIDYLNTLSTKKMINTKCKIIQSKEPIDLPHDDLYPLPIYQVENIYAYIRLVMYPNCHACNV